MNDAQPSERLATAFRRAGTGDRVVLIHGLGEDHRSWHEQQRSLAPQCQTIAYDIRGHGLTPIGDADGTLEQLGEDLIALLEELGGAYSLVGFSLGGTIAIWAAAQRPELVERIVLIATSAIVGRRAAAGYGELIQLLETRDQGALRGYLVGSIDEGVERKDIDVEALIAYELDAIGDGHGMANAARAMARLHDEPLTPMLAMVRCHALVVAGEHDKFCPERAQSHLLEHLPRADRLTIRGAGHRVNVDASAALTDAARAGLWATAGEPGRSS